MNRFIAKYPWLRPLLCGLLAAALLLPVLLPALRLQRQEPANPIQETNIQPVEPLSFGDGEGGTRAGAPDETADGPDGGHTQPEDEPQQDPDEPQQQEPDETPAQQPQQDPSRQEPGTETPADGSGEELPGEDGTEPDGGTPDLGLVLNWRRYGREHYRSLCPADRTVRQDVRTAQLPDGQLRYELELQGADVGSAEIVGVQIAENGGSWMQADVRGTLAMQLGPDGADSYYSLQAQAVVTRALEDGSRQEETVSFTFVLVYSDSLDLEAELQWVRADGGTDRLTCQPGRQAAAALKGEELPEGLLQYRFRLDGESAGEAKILSADYRAQSGESGAMLPEGGTLGLQGMDDGKNIYTVTLLTEVESGGQTRRLTFTFRLEWREEEEVRLELVWIKNMTEAQTVACEPDGQAAAEIRRTDLRRGELQYRLALNGKNAAQASIVSAALTPDGGSAQALAVPNGSAALTLPDGAAAMRYVLTVQARCQRSDGSLRNMTFTYILRYSGGVGLDMQYTLLDGTVRTVHCANGQSKTAETVYSDELEEAVLPFTMTLSGGEDAEGLQITKVTCYQSGSGRMTTLPNGGSGSIPLLTDPDGSEGENQFKVTAQSAAGETHTFTINVPYKLRGDGKVIIETNLDEEPKVMNGTRITLTMTAWSEKKEDGTLIARMTASDTVVTLDGETLRCDGTVGGRLQYTMIPQNPEAGDKNEHTLHIVCEDAYGNRGEKTLTLPGERTRKGEPIGTASIYIDMTVLGLGTTSAISYEVLSEEPASYSVAKAVWGADFGEPFGASEASFGWPESEAGYDNTFDVDFYLSRLGDGTNMAARSNALRGKWTDYGTDRETVLQRIDSEFGENSPYAALWRSIYLAGIDMNPCHETSVGQFDFTRGSGWMYSIGGGTNYPVKGLSEYELQDGDVLVLRYTLAVGRDIGDGTEGSAFCVSALNGTLSVSHQWEKTDGGDGTVQEVCASCGKIRACDHPDDQLEFRESEDGTQCYEYCRKCGKPVTEPEEHDWSFEKLEDDEAQHRKVCSRCKKELTEEHRFGLIKDQPATCKEAGEKVYRCLDCGQEKRTETEATGEHDWTWKADAEAHWQVCRTCEEEREGSRAAHSYQWDTDWEDWSCTDCGYNHGELCIGTPEAVAEHCTCSHEERHCGACGAAFSRDAAGAFDYPHSYVTAAEECTCSREVRICSECGARDVTEQTGAFADRYPHHYDENGVCTDCGAGAEGPTEPEPEPTPEPTPEPKPTPGGEPENTEE